MYQGKKVAVIVPAYNEEKMIGRVIETMPEFVDCIVIIDDNSTDSTLSIVKQYVLNDTTGRIVCLEHDKNRGNGAARVTGLGWVKDKAFDIIALMDGDGQMDPLELSRLIDPVVQNRTDVVKGNRLFTGEAWSIIPKTRYLGNAVLSFLTKIASGYWHIADSQSGYMAMSNAVIQMLPLERLYTDYGFPNDFLIHLNVEESRVRDMPIRPVYNIGEQSDMRIGRVIPRISWLLFCRFLWRLKEKYVIRNFHPLVFFYFTSFILFLLAAPLAMRVFLIWFDSSRLPPVNFLTVVFLVSTGIQFLLFAMWFDMDHNKHLTGK